MDLEAWRLAREMGKEVRAMETIDEQIATLESVPVERIVRFFRQCGLWKRYIRRNMRAYLKGDLDAMMGTSAEFPSRTDLVVDRRDAVFLERMLPPDRHRTLRRVRGLRAHVQPAENAGRSRIYGPQAAENLMLGPDRLDHVAAHAVVPEQLVCYVRAVAGSTPRRFDACLGYETPDDLMLIGYPLHDSSQGLLDEQALSRSVDLALKTSLAPRVTVLAASRPRQAPVLAAQEASGRPASPSPEAYWALPIPAPAPGQKLRNLLRRAGREVTLDQGRDLDRERLALIGRYLESRDLEPGTRFIFRNIPAYVQTCPGTLVVSARLDRKSSAPHLAGFTVGDFTSLSTAAWASS